MTQNRLPLSRFTVLDLTAHRAGRFSRGTQAKGDAVAQGDLLGHIN